MHAQTNNDPLLMKLVLNSLMSNPENQSDPYLLLSSAHLALNEAQYTEALKLLKASQNYSGPSKTMHSLVNGLNSMPMRSLVISSMAQAIVTR